MTSKLDSSSTQNLSWPKFLAYSVVCIATVITLLNPSSTQELSIVPRAAFWLIQVSLLLTMMQLMQLGLQQLNSIVGWPVFAQLVLSGLLGAALFVPIGISLDRHLGLDQVTVALPQDWHLEFFEELAFVSPPALAAWLGLNAIRLKTDFDAVRDKGVVVTKTDEDLKPHTGPLENQADGKTGDTDSLKVPFFALLPTALGTDLVALSAELHYTRVYTAAGEALIFYPFGRAIEELKEAGYPGLQVHRSHWIAQVHILQKKRLSSRGFLQMDTGLKIPVSRRRKNDVSQILTGP
ncbi:LytTR family DNA-binding domain-containing protein [Aquidulcibacter sp.]|uniref:LytTR family DNA-binding domain-containing protein n=1 Tax=Aquidulcibacter sp. TaxID=2052990 RepID=UPI0025C288DC|nr:LytTR family DNA-binding domain-containing protein [Aquidulcibacter sp.]MCA3693098.1 LytTR family transcriptional regulator [Aquidulcibacter sp.]